MGLSPSFQRRIISVPSHFNRMPHPILSILTLLLVAACNRPAVVGPQQTLRRYVAAVRADQPDLAYALLSPRMQKRIPREEFADRWRKSRPELLQQARAIAAGLEGKKLDLNATVTLAGGDTRLLRFQKGWRLTGDFHSAATRSPRETVVALLQAAERRDYRAVKALMAPKVARAFDREIEKRIKALRGGLRRGIRVRGNRASLRFGSFKLELIKEDGRWKVYDFD